MKSEQEYTGDLTWFVNEEGACAQPRGAWTNFSVFEGNTPEQVQTAKAICAGCKVKELCDDYAVWLGEEGRKGMIWAGLTEEERSGATQSTALDTIRDDTAVQLDPLWGQFGSDLPDDDYLRGY